MSTKPTRHNSLVAAVMAGDTADAALHVARGEKAHQVYALDPGQFVSLLHVVAADGMYDVVEFLLNNGAQIDFRDHSGQTALFGPCISGDERMVTLLLTYGADPNVRDTEFGKTPLHDAAIRGRTEVAKVLIAFGADVNPKDTKGVTPLMLAAHRGHRATAELLSSGKVIDVLRKQFEDARKKVR